MDIENIKNAGIELQNSQYYFKIKIKYSIIIFVSSLFLQIWIISLYGVGQSYTVHNDVVYDYQNNPVFIPQNGGENFDQTKGLILLGGVNFFTFLLIAINGLVMNFKIFNSFKNAGEYLHEHSETIEVKSNLSENIIDTQETLDEIPDVISFDYNVVKFADGVESVLFQKKITGQIIYFIETESKKYFYEDLQKGYKGSYLLKVKGIISEDGLYNNS